MISRLYAAPFPFVAEFPLIERLSLLCPPRRRLWSALTIVTEAGRAFAEPGRPGYDTTKSAEAARAYFQVGLSRTPEDRQTAELFGWAALTQALLNLSETITRN